MKIIVGLGNEGDNYANTRHNVGFMVVDQLAKKYHIPLKYLKLKAVLSTGIILNSEVLIAKPLTYMNLSGIAVKKILTKYSVPVNDLLVVHDDIDLVLGKVKKKTGGGDAGHLGVKSIVQHLNDNNFLRIRVGIGRPGDSSDITDWVLSPFSKDEKLTLEKSIDTAIQKIKEFLN